MAEYNNSNGGGSNSDWGSWIPIIVLFCIPTPVTWIIAFFMLVNKLRGMGSPRNWFRGNVKRHPYDIQHDAQSGAEWEQVNWNEGEQKRPEDYVTSRRTSDAYAGTDKAGAQKTGAGKSATVNGVTYEKKSGGKKNSGKKAPKRKAAKESGRGLIIGGAILSGIFGMSSVATLVELIQSIVGGWYFDSDLTGFLFSLMFLAGGLWMLGAGVGINRRTERYANYLAYIGTNREVSLAHMAATFDVPVRKLCKDLRRMLSKGILPTGYLDLAEGKLFLTEMGYRPPEPKKAESAPEKTAEEEENAILREIRQVNDEIPGEEMSAKIYRIEEITGKILDYQKSHPNRESQLRSFLNYYLPTTLKILRAYAQLDAQGIEGENISAAKARIEGMMDQVVAGFEKQLDKLFQDDALDIASDVEVLENMLKKDGLSDGQGMTLGG